IVGVLGLLFRAGVLEELMSRGSGFQTLLGGAPAVVPVLLFSIYFGWAHWNNPDRTLFSTANTVLAGIWLSIAYLKTRSLWFPTALPFTWNWMMGAFFRISISGRRIPQHPVLLPPSGSTGLVYGG